MSVASDVVAVPKAIIKPLLSPKTLLIGAGVMLGTGAFLSMIVPGIGQFAGLRPMPVLPKVSPWFNRWPFVAMPMNGTGATAPASMPAGASQEDIGRAIVNATQSSVNSVQGYVNSMLQVI